MKKEEITPKPPHAPDASKPSSRRMPAWARTRRAAGALGLFLLAFVLWAVQPDRRGEAVHAGWGAESMHGVAGQAMQWLPIAPANACGLGASSCFKCHNGKRAAAPTSEPAKAPWHAQHAKVNNSCVGCHKGNPRVMKEDVAHAKMLAKPRDNSEGSCATCHTADLAKVQAAYTGGK